MVQLKKMNEELFANLLRDLTAAGELIRARQEEKQKLLDAFDAESKRFFFGKISQKAWKSSVDKTNLELQRLDKNRREAIKKAGILCDRIKKLCNEQLPIGYRATLTGISGGKVAKKKKAVKKKSSKRKK
jgi:hypothetical protein